LHVHLGQVYLVMACRWWERAFAHRPPLAIRYL